VKAYQRHLIRIAHHHARQGQLDLSSRVFLEPVSWTKENAADSLGMIPPGWAEAIIAALRRQRRDHRTLGADVRNRFNSALQKAYQAGTYQQLSAIHSDMGHRMHSSHGAIGTQRFLPWHRQYLLECENLLRTYEPSVRIPYWHYQHQEGIRPNDHLRPDWVWQPPNVKRGTPDASFSLPTQQTLDSIDQNTTYTGFTFALEGGAHNNVHNWCNGTIRSIPTAAQDPIFWLLHANVDRIWDLWQATNNGVPSLNGTDAVLDPWGPRTATDVDSVIGSGYSYRVYSPGVNFRL
jgi:tyrosinase